MSKPLILGIDPGNKETGYALVDGETLKPIRFGKLDNYALLDELTDIFETFNNYSIHVAMENFRNYGMVVGQSVFDSCIWLGRLWQHCREYNKRGETPIVRMKHIYREEEKLCICHSPKANDVTIKQALVDRFAQDEPNHGKGTKKSPGFFYNFRADVWTGFALCVTYHDLYMEKADEVIENA